MNAAQPGVIRVTTIHAREGMYDALVDAAWENARAARAQPGCMSAEVGTAPGDDVVVLSRWTDEAAVQAFLAWHKTIAHASLRDFATAAPTSVHYAVDAGDAFAAEWSAWHSAHEQLRAAPDGFLAITSARWLTPEPERFDDVPGAWRTTPDGPEVTLADGETLTLDGRVLTGVHAFGPFDGRGAVRPTWETDAGTALVEVAAFGGHDVLRPRHPDNPALTGYEGTPAYAPDPRFVVEGRFTPFDAPRRAVVDTVVDGLESVFDAPGTVSFDLDGTDHMLTAFRDGDGLRLLFTDATSGKTTYAASRNLHIGAPDAAGRVTIDFNRAVNLPCVYTASAMCPLPPAENHLAVAIEAGEKLPR